MKRNTDLIRQLLIDLEGGDGKNAFGMETILKLSTIKDETVPAHVRLMVDAGLLTTFVDHYGQTHSGKFSISNAGYDFLDSVRDEGVWRKTKDVIEDAKGFTLELIADIAKGFVKTQVKKLTGVEV
jgi:hypothetical protein